MERRRKNDGLFHLYYHIKTTHRDYTITTLRPQDDSPIQYTDQLLHTTPSSKETVSHPYHHIVAVDIKI